MSIQGGNKGHQKRWCMLCRIIKQFQGRNVKDPKSGWRHLGTSQGDKNVSSKQLFVYFKEPIAVTTPANVCSGGHQREVTRHCGQQTRSVCQMLLWLLSMLSSSPCSLFVASSFHILTKQGARGAPHHQHFRSHGPAGVTPVLCHFLSFFAFFFCFS